jgi:hypothetical protein
LPTPVKMSLRPLTKVAETASATSANGSPKASPVACRASASIAMHSFPLATSDKRSSGMRAELVAARQAVEIRLKWPSFNSFLEPFE